MDKATDHLRRQGRLPERNVDSVAYLPATQNDRAGVDEVLHHGVQVSASRPSGAGGRSRRFSSSAGAGAIRARSGIALSVSAVSIAAAGEVGDGPAGLHAGRGACPAISASSAPMERQPSEVTFHRQFGRYRVENFSLPYGVADCAAPPVSKRRLRSGPNLHPGDTHHCADGLFARDKHLVHDSANACSLVLFLARPRAGAAGVETCMDSAWRWSCSWVHRSLARCMARK